MRPPGQPIITENNYICRETDLKGETFKKHIGPCYDTHSILHPR